MQLHRLRVRNYRIHKDTEIEFDARLTLVEGPNEAGKSTLMEAARRALFLRANYNGALRDEMRSRAGGGHPEVELEFEIGGERWTLRKTFAGPSGTVSLTPETGASLHGEEADARLSELLRGEEPLGGRAAASQLPSRWQHIWVQQGLGGVSPVEALGGQSTTLVELLRGSGNSTVMMSPLDKRVMARVERDWGEIHPPSGQVAARSRLRALMDAHEKAKAGLEDWDQRVSARAAQTREVEEATAFLDRATHQRTELRGALREVEARLEQVQEGRRKLEDSVRIRHQAEERLSRLEAKEKKVRDLEADRERLKEELLPLRNRTEALASELKEARKGLEARKRSLEEARDRARAAKREAALARATVQLVEALREEETLGQELEAVQEVVKRLAEEERLLASLPQVDEGILRSLEELDRNARDARTALEATAAAVEVIRSTAPVAVNGEALTAGEIRILTDDGEVEIGQVARLRIRPGGGSSLADARSRADSAEDSLREALLAASAESLEDARSAFQEAVRRRVSIGHLREELTRMGGNTAEERKREAGGVVAEAKRRFRALGRDPEGTLPFPAEAQATLRHTEELERQADQQVDSEQEFFRGAEGEVEALEARHRKEIAAMEESKRELTKVEAQAENAVAEAGEEEARGQELESAHAAVIEAREREEAAKAGLRALDPNRLEKERDRWIRSLQDLDRRKEEHLARRHQALGELRADGSVDPHARLDEARAELELATRRRTVAEREARSLTLLRQEFKEAQSALGAAIAGPLADRVNPYVQLIFGGGAQASLEMEGMELQEPALLRRETFPFAALSTGTQEQFGAAFRLAAAEVLASAFGGTLPVLLDDTFSHSDDGRIDGLSRALYHAAQNDLQVILFTCRAEAWTGLGGRTVSIGSSGPHRPTV